MHYKAIRRPNADISGKCALHTLTICHLGTMGKLVLGTVEEKKVHRRIKAQKADGLIMLLEYTYTWRCTYFTVSRWYLTRPVLTGSQSQTDRKSEGE